MEEMYVLNTSILTDYGSYDYTMISEAEAKALASVHDVKSAVGHESTAKIISTVLGIEVPMNRINYKQEVGDSALVFKMNQRAPEGVIMTADEISKIGYQWGLLVRRA